MPPPLSRGATGEEAAPMDNSVKSDDVLLLDVDGEALGAGQLLACGDLDVLISHNAIQLGIRFHHRILHQDAVLDDGTLLDLDTAEQHTVLDGALDDAAVGQQGVADVGAGDIAGGVVVADLGVDGALLGEELFQVLSSVSFRFSSK